MIKNLGNLSNRFWLSTERFFRLELNFTWSLAIGSFLGVEIENLTAILTPTMTDLNITYAGGWSLWRSFNFS